MSFDKSTTRSNTKEADLILTNAAFMLAMKECIEKAVEDKMGPLIRSIQHLETIVERQSERITKYEEQFESMYTQINHLENKYNEIEQYSRRNCLRIYGMPETTGEVTDDLVINLARDKLEVTLSAADIDRSHRIGRNLQDKTRAVIVKFTNYRARSSVIKARRKLKGSGTAICEDLTKSNLKLLKATADHKDVKSAWSLDGKIFAITTKNGHDQPKRRIMDLQQLDQRDN